MHDAICVVRNLIRDSKCVYGGGAVELALSNFIESQSYNFTTVEQYAVRAFADALEMIPMTLAENCGLAGMEIVADLKYKQM